MCGIVGMAGDFNQTHKLAFRDMLTVCQVRGRDSTGVVAVDSNGKYDLVKRLGTPDLLLETKEYDRRVDTGLKKVLIGHCRAKTFGAVSRENAHPFEHGGLCGVHNGTLQNYTRLERARDFDVDSNWLYWHMSEFGVQETISQLDEGGAWALVWWNENDGTLNFLRNKERPLWFCHSKDQKVMYWASEPWMFGTVERRLDLWDGGDKGSKFYMLPADTWMKFEVAHFGQKASDVFKMHAPVEVKGEVRGHTGNLGWSGGSVGGNPHGFRPATNVNKNVGGGQVTSPFLEEPDLNDRIDDLIDGSKIVHLLPNKPNTSTPAESTTTVGGGDKSSSRSRQILDLRTALKSSSSTRQKRELLTLTTSANPQQESKGSSSSNLSGCALNSPRAKSPVTFRSIKGEWYVTDSKTGREFSEKEFDDKTGCKCIFCTKPIGDITEVHQIFIRDNGTFNEDITFIGKCCTKPAVHTIDMNKGVPA